MDKFNPYGNTCAFFIAKLQGKGKLLAALRHNKRTIQAERGADSHIDSTRMHLNYCLVGDEAPEAISKAADALMAQAKGKRKDNVQAVECLFSLPLSAGKDTTAFFQACANWVGGHFGGELLSFDVHLDESYPHAHALILPIVDGAMGGSAMVGDRKRLKHHLDSFYFSVASKFGFIRPVKKLKGKAKQQAASAVINAIVNDPVMQSSICPVIIKQIHDCPDIYANYLGLKVEERVEERSFAAIMTSRGRGRSRE